MTANPTTLSDGELDSAAGGMIFVMIPGMGDDSVTTESTAKPRAPGVAFDSASTGAAELKPGAKMTTTTRAIS